MLTITITEKTCSNEEMADILRKIADQIYKGYNYHTGWALHEDEVFMPAKGAEPDNLSVLPDFRNFSDEELADFANGYKILLKN